MSPNYNNGQKVIIKTKKSTIKRFDVILFKYNGEKLIKCVVGLPGDNIEYENSKLYVNGNYTEEKMIESETKNFKLASIGYNKIPENYYFVMGDNREFSKDSRHFGLVNKNDIIGIID